ncbi:GNAT family N-acetyltransferase [Cellvibrio sp.]
MELVVRKIQAADDLVKLTELIHAAYAPHAESGLRYCGTHQTVEDTAKRLDMGICLVAFLNGECVGTGLFRWPQPESPVALYRDPTVWTLAQFCVSPKYKGRGIGKQIHTQGLELLKEKGISKIALDTAEPAKNLIKMYESWGYEVVGTCDWRPFTNYSSIVMAMSF